MRRLGFIGTAVGIALGVGTGLLVAGGMLLAFTYAIFVAFDTGGAPSVSRVVMTTKQFEALRPGTSREEIELRVGAGSANGQEIPEPPGVRCSYYDAQGSSGGADAFQLCFAAGRLRQKHRVDVASGAGGGGFD